MDLVPTYTYLGSVKQWNVDALSWGASCGDWDKISRPQLCQCLWKFGHPSLQRDSYS